MVKETVNLTPDGSLSVDIESDSELAAAIKGNGVAVHTFSGDAGYLLRAIRAVLPHTTGTEKHEQLHRVRMYVGESHVDFLATSGHTALVCRVDGRALELDPYDKQWSVDLWPADLAVVAKLFKPPKDEQIELRFDVMRDHRVRITDVSGLPGVDLGRSYVVPTVAGGEKMPDVRAIILSTMDAERGMVGCVTYRPDVLSRWANTATALGYSAVIEPTREARPFVVTIGDECVGVLQPTRNDDSPDTGSTAVRARWRRQLDVLPDFDPTTGEITEPEDTSDAD